MWEVVLLVVFAAGYLAIALEHSIGINKAASALLVGVLCWIIYVTHLIELLPAADVPAWFRAEVSAEVGADGEAAAELPRLFAIEGQHLQQTGEIASILFFLIGAMTIVELIDAHEGFALITDRVRTRSKRKLLWVVGVLTFFMSAALDNLTTTIVMVSLLRKLVADRQDRLKFVGLVVIAANAGGAWTVIGDITTTMLWIKHKTDAVQIMQALLLPSLVCLLVPLIGMSWPLRGTLDPVAANKETAHSGIQPWHQWLFLGLGLCGLLAVPVIKAVTHLPPYMGMMLSLSVLWVVSEVVGRDFDERTRSSTHVLAALKRVDLSTVLFFLGILLAVGSLSASGILADAAAALDRSVGDLRIVAVLTGLLSAVVDNVPLVAAGIDMYDLPMNDRFWELLAYCAGTGGSCLVIGSAAGVAAMGIEHINFVWYLRAIGPWALAGYLAGASTLLAMG